MVVNVTEPPALVGSLAYLPWTLSRSIGPEVVNPATGNLEARVLIPNTRERGGAGNINGCPRINPANGQPIFPAYEFTTADDGTPFAGNVLLLLRSRTCDFALVHQAAMQLNPAAILYAINPPTTFEADNNVFFNMPFSAVGSFGAALSILSIGSEDGSVLLGALQGNPNMTVRVSIPGSGPATNLTKLAIADMRQTMNQDMWAFILPPLTAQRIQFWNRMNPDSDPCVFRPLGLWCEHGEVVHLNWATPPLQVQGQLSDFFFDSMKKLAHIFIDSNRLSGPFPPSICNDPGSRQLSQIYMSGNGFTSFPDCLDQLPRFQRLSARNNRISALPGSALRSPTAVVIDLANNGGSLPAPLTSASFSSLNRGMNYLDLSSNRLTGQVPAVQGFPNLTDLLLKDNMLSGPVAPDQFDNNFSLMTIQLGGNRLTGPLPDLAGLPNMWRVGFSNNNFTGGVPAGWTDAFISQLQYFELDNNQFNLSATFVRLAQSQATKFDLSHNRLTNGNNPCNLVSSLATGSLYITELDLSYNQLAGRCAEGNFDIIPERVKIIKLDHNGITSLPNDLFSVQSIEVLDLSFNALDGTTDLPSAAPPVSLALLNLQGNPAFRSASGRLPSFAAFDIRSTRKTLGDPYSCFPIVGSGANERLTFNVDPTYYLYSGCTCDDGTYYQVPLCLTIPTANTAASPTPVLNPFRALPANASAVPLMPQAFSDSWYGNARTLKGIDTAWTIDLRGNAVRLVNGSESIVSAAGPGTSPVRGLYLTFFLDLTRFRLASDSLTVLTGGQSLDGELAAVIRGDNSFTPVASPSTEPVVLAQPAAVRSAVLALPSLGIVRVPVSADLVSVRFSSRGTGGQYFLAVYSASGSCIPGYEIGLLGACIVSKSEYVVSDALRYVIYAVAAFFGFLTLAVSAVVFKYRNTSIVRASSRPFTALFLLMILLLNGSAVLFAIVPNGDGHNGDSICSARLWLPALGLMTCLSILVAKSFRVSIIFGSKVLLQIRNVGASRVLSIMAALVGAEAVMLAVFQGMDMTYAARLSFDSGRFVWGCNTRNGFDAWMGVNIALFAAVMVSGAVVAFKTRSVPSAFNESSHILFSLQMLTFFLILLVPLDWALVENSPNASIAIQGGGQLILSLFLLLSNFVPKLYYIFTGRADDKSLLFQTQSKSGDSSMSSASHSQSSVSSGSGVQLSSTDGSRA
jgi:hypothetical protein